MKFFLIEMYFLTSVLAQAQSQTQDYLSMLLEINKNIANNEQKAFIANTQKIRKQEWITPYIFPAETYLPKVIILANTQESPIIPNTQLETCREFKEKVDFMKSYYLQIREISLEIEKIWNNESTSEVQKMQETLVLQEKTQLILQQANVLSFEKYYEKSRRVFYEWDLKRPVQGGKLNPLYQNSIPRQIDKIELNTLELGEGSWFFSSQKPVNEVLPSLEGPVNIVDTSFSLARQLSTFKLCFDPEVRLKLRARILFLDGTFGWYNIRLVGNSTN